MGLNSETEIKNKIYSIYIYIYIYINILLKILVINI